MVRVAESQQLEPAFYRTNPPQLLPRCSAPFDLLIADAMWAVGTDAAVAVHALAIRSLPTFSSVKRIERRATAVNRPQRCTMTRPTSKCGALLLRLDGAHRRRPTRRSPRKKAASASKRWCQRRTIGNRQRQQGRAPAASRCPAIRASARPPFFAVRVPMVGVAVDRQAPLDDASKRTRHAVVRARRCRTIAPARKSDGDAFVDSVPLVGDATLRVTRTATHASPLLTSAPNQPRNLIFVGPVY